ncbi:hypothetical protein SH528x_001464 [Novipirellula sp. SH528]|uniref:hypothetical protein n=1 Tax=Novipirellula sp. SH528 TaxID=3454466 RepID=UPI003FA0A7FF
MAPPKSNAVLWFVAFIFAALLILFITFSNQWANGWRDTTPRGPLTAVTDWPEPIIELRASLNESGANTDGFSVYLLQGQPGQTLSTVVCRLPVDDATWDAIRRKLDLQLIPDANGDSMRSSIVPLSDASWWPESSPSVAYFASARLLAGDEADLYQAAHDSGSKMAYIHYHFNF